jgi:hypothetical protein
MRPGTSIYVTEVDGVPVVIGIVARDARYEWKFQDLLDAAKTLEPHHVLIEELKILDEDVWFSGTGRRATLRNIAREIARVDKCNSDEPAILVDPCGLVDGTHRALKAYLRGATHLLCVRMTIDELFEIPHVRSEMSLESPVV